MHRGLFVRIRLVGTWSQLQLSWKCLHGTPAVLGIGLKGYMGERSHFHFEGARGMQDATLWSGCTLESQVASL